MNTPNSTLLIRNIGSLVNVSAAQQAPGKQMDKLVCIPDAALIVRNGLIDRYGPMHELCAPTDGGLPVFDREIDARGGMVLPAFCDSHTHLLFPASREQEMTDRLRGLSYAEITARGGGILNSARRMQSVSDEQLLEAARRRLDAMLARGTATVEIKSGYGLTTEQELRMLRLIRTLSQESPMTIKATFLGAHAIPEPFRKHPERYISLITEEMIPQVAAENLADFVDVFCERDFFSVDQTARILEVALEYGLRPRLHTNQFTHSGGIELAIRYNALSVDHLEEMNAGEIALLSESTVIPTLLPGCSFFMNIPYPPARRLIDNGLPVALATDFNPGTNPSGDMKFVLSLACLKMAMTPAEAITAATLNGAAALGLGESHGSIAIGKRADLILAPPLPSLDYIPYAYTDKLVRAMVIGGELLDLADPEKL